MGGGKHLIRSYKIDLFVTISYFQLQIQENFLPHFFRLVQGSALTFERACNLAQAIWHLGCEYCFDFLNTFHLLVSNMFFIFEATCPNLP